MVGEPSVGCRPFGAAGVSIQQRRGKAMVNWSIGCPAMAPAEALKYLEKEVEKHNGVAKLPDDKAQELRQKVVDLAVAAVNAQEGDVAVSITAYGSTSKRQDGSYCCTVQIAVGAQAKTPAVVP
jgi:hypothetical protein